MRREWMPVLARVYHISPDRQKRLTLGEFDVLCADYERLKAEEHDGY